MLQSVFLTLRRFALEFQNSFGYDVIISRRIFFYVHRRVRLEVSLNELCIYELRFFVKYCGDGFVLPCCLSEKIEGGDMEEFYSVCVSVSGDDNGGNI